jgi:signal transduction histidine kinase
MNAAMIAAEKSKLSPAVARCAQEDVEILEQLSNEIRTTSHLLHPPLLDEVGLECALRSYVEGFAKRSNIEVELEVPDLEGLKQQSQLVLFRILQESLTNIHRHSGSPTATVTIRYIPGALEMKVQDQGRGIEKNVIDSGASVGVGLRGMRERVRGVGGRLQIASDGKGTTITVLIPTEGGVANNGGVAPAGASA